MLGELLAAESPVLLAGKALAARAPERLQHRRPVGATLVLQLQLWCFAGAGWLSAVQACPKTSCSSCGSRVQAGAGTVLRHQLRANSWVSRSTMTERITEPVPLTLCFSWKDEADSPLTPTFCQSFREPESSPDPSFPQAEPASVPQLLLGALLL